MKRATMKDEGGGQFRVLGLIVALCLLAAGNVRAADPAPASSPVPPPAAQAVPASAAQAAPPSAAQAAPAPAAQAAPVAPDQALAALRDGLAKAIAEASPRDAAQYDAKLFQVAAEIPAPLQKKEAEASAIAPDKQRAAGVWSKIAAKTASLLASGNLEEARSRAEQGLGLARENFGDKHITTVFSTRDLALIHQLSGRMEEAEKTYQDAVALAGAALGEGHPTAVKIRILLAKLYETELRFDRAAGIYESVVAALASGLGVNHPVSLSARVSLARVYRNQGHYKEAEASLRSACDRLKERLAPRHSETLTCLSQLASVRMQLGDLDGAEKLYGDLTPVMGIVAGADSQTALSTLTDQGELHIKRGRFQDAAAALSAVIRDAAGKHPPVEAQAKVALAHAYDELGRYAEAEPLLKEALAYQTKVWGAPHPGTVNTLSQLAGIYRRQGRLMEAERAFADAHATYRKVLGDGHPSTIAAANNLGEILEKEGLYDQAEPFLRAAHEAGRKAMGEENPLVLASMNNLALLYESQGTFDNAEPLYLSAIRAYEKKLGKEHPDTVSVTNNLAYLHLMQEKDDKAEPIFTEVLGVWTRTLGEKHQNTLKALNNLARVKHRLNKLDEAETLFKRALDLRTGEFGGTHMDTLRSMHDLAALYRTRKMFDLALPLLEKTLALDEETLGPNHPYTFETLNTLAGVKEDMNDLPGALKLREKIFQRRSDFLDRMLWATGENAREGYIRLHAPESHAYLRLLPSDKTGGGRRAFEAALARKGLLLKIASEIQQVTRLSQDPALTERARELTETRKALAALMLSGPTPETKERHLETIGELEEKISSLEGELGRASVRFRETAGRMTAEEVLAALPAKAVLVDYLIYRDGGTEKALITTVTKKGGKPVFGLARIDDLAPVNQAVADYRATIQDEDAEDEDIRKAGRSTYDLVLGPVAKTVGAAKLIYLVPDGILNILPFNALVGPKGKYLIEDADLHILSSARDLVPSKVPTAKGGYLIDAGPNYDKNDVAPKDVIETLKGRRSAGLQDGLRAFSSGLRGLKFSPLPGAEKEGRLIVEEVAAAKKSSRVYSNDEAQEASLREVTEPPEILHVATHGFFLKPDDTLKKRLLKLQRSAEISVPPPGDNPLLRAGLAFAGINANAQFLGEIDTDNDGVLTALEVLGLNLTGTRLAILSACETGLGEVHEGEGVYGLRRAFQEAGVRSVVSSLWEVSDAGTQALMTGLYKRLLKGTPVHQALRESQLALLRSDQWNNPYVWSAFMMVER